MQQNEPDQQHPYQTQQQQQKRQQQIKAKEIQQQDLEKVKTVVGRQKNVSNGKVAAKECTATPTAHTVAAQQVNSATDNCKSNNCKKLVEAGGAEDGNSTQRCHWQWRRSRARLGKDQQQQQQYQQHQQSSEAAQQVYKSYADEQLSITSSRAVTALRRVPTTTTTNVSS